jgi:glycosyltransferase involved in cell wall biosynthesis
MPRIVIDCTQYCLDPHSGLKTYHGELAAALARAPGEERYVLLHCLRPAKARTEPLHLDDPRFETVVLPYSKWNMQRWDLFSRWRLGRALGPIDLWHMTMLEPALRFPGRYVVTCHDLCSLRLAEGKPKPRRWMVPTAQGAARVFTCSQSTRQDLHCALGVPLERIIVTPYAVHPQPPSSQPRSQLPAPLCDRPYFLQLASVSPRKNVPATMEAFARFVAASRYPGLLAIAGGLGSLDATVRADATRLGVAERVVFLGFVDDLRILIRHADAFLYPSLCEGFGLPILEAMAAGAPVLTSNTTSMPEVGGDAAVYVDPRDVASMAAGLGEVLKDRDRRVQVGFQQALRFSWDMTAKLTLAAYRQALAEP